MTKRIQFQRLPEPIRWTRGLLGLAQRVAEKQPNVDPATMACSAVELAWRARGRHAIYVPSVRLTDLLTRSAVEVEASDFTPPFGGACAFVFPKGARVGEVDIPSCYFACLPPAELCSLVAPEASFPPTQVESDMAEGRRTMLAFSDGERPDPMMSHMLRREMGFTPRALMFESHQLEDWNGWSGSMEMFEAGHDSGIYESAASSPLDVRVKPLEGGETAMTYTLTKACYALSLFVQAHPELLVDGLPEGFVGRAKGDLKAKTLSSPEWLGGSHASPQEHLRAGHFRTLRHERYRRCSDGAPRVVYVREAVVAGGTTPHTLVTS